VSGIYDGILLGLLRERVCIAPCAPRIKYLPNKGIHGQGDPKWDDPIPLPSPISRPLAYHVLGQGDWTPPTSKHRLQQTSAVTCVDPNPPTLSPPFRIWSSDMHIGPIADLKAVWSGLHVHGRRVEVVDQSLSGHCHLTDTCARGLRVLNSSNGETLGDDPTALIEAFHRAYAHDTVMQSVDAFVCSHPTSLCQVFLPFNKPIIIYATSRYEMGRHSADRWKEWNRDIERIVEGGGVVTANNHYDTAYIQHFTGIRGETIESLCDTKVSYLPTRPEMLLHMPQAVENAIAPMLQQAIARRHSPLVFRHIRRLYPSYNYTDLAAHPAMVIIPYQVSVMSAFEIYRMNIPIFTPSRSMLTEWHVHHKIVFQRSWSLTFGKPVRSSVIPRHSEAPNRYDPNDDFTPEAIAQWLALADLYQWPHITYFDSLEELVEKLHKADLPGISHSMRMHNLQVVDGVAQQWQRVLSSVLAQN